jgi:hypothetical protein
MRRYASQFPRLKTWGWNGTKSAFADYPDASAPVAGIGAAEAAGAGMAVGWEDVAAESAKADFVPFQRRVSNPA